MNNKNQNEQNKQVELTALERVYLKTIEKQSRQIAELTTNLNLAHAQLDVEREIHQQALQELEVKQLNKEALEDMKETVNKLDKNNKEQKKALDKE